MNRYRVTIFSPDRHIIYGPATPENKGVGGGITSRIRMALALKRMGNEVELVINCREEQVYRGVVCRPLRKVHSIETDVFIVNSSGGEYSLKDLEDIEISAGLRVYLASGLYPPEGFKPDQYDFVYAKSNFLRNQILEQWHVQPGKVFTAYNGFEESYFQEFEKASPERDPYRLVYCSHPDKGLDTALEILKRLRSHDDRYTLHVYGGRELWGQQADPVGEVPGVFFAGMIGQRQLAGELLQAGCSICLQDISDTFGMVVTESQRAGCVVIASETGAYPELVQDGVNGFLIKGSSKSEHVISNAVGKIRYLSENPEALENIRSTAQLVSWSSDLIAWVWTQHWNGWFGPRPYHGDNETDTTACPECGSPLVVMADGHHCTSCGFYAGDPGHFPAAEEIRMGRKPGFVEETADRMKEKVPIFIAGYYGFGNTGDEAILAGMMTDLHEEIPGAVFTVASGNPSQSFRWHGVDAVHWTDLEVIDQMILASKLVILGGGGILHDSHSFHLDPGSILSPSYSGLSYYASIPLMASLHDIPCMLYGAGIGPLQSQDARDLCSAVIDLCSVASVRDEYSLDYFQTECAMAEADQNRILIAADPAFSYRQSEGYRPPDFPEFFQEGDRPVLGVSLRRWDFAQAQEDWEAETAAALDILVREDRFRILFIPFQVLEETIHENDRRVCDRVLGLMEEGAEAAVAKPSRSFEDSIWMVQQCDAVLGMRYHSVLFGLGTGIPVSAFCYDAKVRSIMTEFGKEAQVLDQPWKAEGVVSAVRASVEEHEVQSGLDAAVLEQRVRRSAKAASKLVSARVEMQASAGRPTDMLMRKSLLDKTRSQLDLLDMRGRLRGLEQEREGFQQMLTRMQETVASSNRDLQKQAELLKEQSEALARFSNVVESKDSEIQDLLIQGQALASQNEKKEAEIQRLEAEKEVWSTERKALEAEHMVVLEDLRRDRDWQAVERERLARELHDIHDSRYWRVLGVYWRTREKIARIRHRIQRSIGFSAAGEKLRRASQAVSSIEERTLSPSADQTHEEVVSLQVRTQPDVIVLPIIDWEFRFQRPQQLARQFARHGQRVFYVRTTFSHYGLKCTEMEANVFQAHLPGPDGLNLYRDVMDEEEAAQLLDGLEQLAFEKGITDAVCMIQLPFWTPLALKLRERFGWLLVYDCMDDHAGFSTNTAEMTAQEDRLLKECDLALVTSVVLQERVEALAPEHLLLPNAVDFDRFAYARAAAVPADMPEAQGPVIGYVGAISDWFDFELLKPAVDAHPEWTFVFIGSTWGADGHQQLAHRDNVHFLGEKPYAEVPGYMRAFDCCVIPFKVSRLTKATNPVKLYEYLAAGKPVVARSLPELEPFADMVHLADDADDFLQGLEQALEEESEEKAVQRVERVRSETWEARFDSFRSKIAKLYGTVSVVIITWNNLDLTRLCLESLLLSSSHPDLEVIVVDNASEDGTPDALREFAVEDDRIKVILNETNRGFGPALNQGIEASRGESIAVLNNDVILTPGWLSVLAARLRQDPGIGMIGPVSNGAWNEALVHAEYTTDVERMAFTRRRASRFAGSIAPIKMLAMYCVLIPRRILGEIGLLDETFGIGMFEDDDLALRLKKAGFKLAVALDVYIHHQSRSSFKKLDREAYDALFNRNRSYFEEKWRVSWEPHVSRDLEPDSRQYEMIEHLIAGRGDAPVVLFHGLKEEDPAFENNLAIAKSLRDRGAVVFFVDPRGLSGRILEYRDGIYLADVPLTSFDAVCSPVIISDAAGREQVLHLRAPRIVYDLRNIPGEKFENVCHSAQHKGMIQDAEVVLAGSEDHKRVLVETGFQRHILVTSSTEDGSVSEREILASQLSGLLGL